MRSLNVEDFKKLNKNKFLQSVFFILSLFYTALIKTKNFLYDRAFLKPKKLPGLTISIGNITLGGSGKSPFLLCLTRKLNNNSSLVILTRGYKGGLEENDVVLLKGGVSIFLRGKQKTIQTDEAFMYSHYFPDIPILISAKRFQAAQLYLNKFPNPEIWILDDGFSHRKLHRDFDILLLDARHLEDSHLFPRGFLREPLSSLKRGHSFILTHSDKTSLMKICKNNLDVKLMKSHFINHKPTNTRTGLPMEKKDLPSCLLCGISHPESFLKATSTIPSQRTLVLGDHSQLSDDIKQILQHERSVLTTEKDYFREKTFFDSLNLAVYVSKYEFRFNSQKDCETLLKKIEKLKNSKKQ